MFLEGALLPPFWFLGTLCFLPPLLFLEPDLALALALSLAALKKGA